MRATIVYEDQGDGSGRFVPHELVLHAAFRHASAVERFRAVNGAAGVVHGLPKKGNGNVLNWLRSDGEKVGKHGPIAAVFDHDEVRRLVNLPGLAMREEVIAAVKAKCPLEPRVFFFVENMESIVARAAVLLQKPVPPKGLNDRDILLTAILKNDDALRRLYETTELGFHEVVDFAAQFLKPPGA